MTDLWTAAELRVTREHLGLTTRWLAERLNVAERTVHRWEAGVQVVPDGVAAEMVLLVTRTDDAVTEAINVADQAGVLVTFRTDADLAAWGEPGWPASWHRAVTARAAAEVEDVALLWWEPPGGA